MKDARYHSLALGGAFCLTVGLLSPVCAQTPTFTPTLEYTQTPHPTYQCCLAVATIGSPGSGLGQVNSMVGLSVDPNNSILYVTDVGNSRVDRFFLNGTPVATPLTGAGGGTALLRNPFDVHCEREGAQDFVYVSDNPAITSEMSYVYKLDPQTDTVAATIASGSDIGFGGLDVDQYGNVYVCLSYYFVAMPTPSPLPPTDRVVKYREYPPGSGRYQAVAILAMDDTPGLNMPNDVLVSDDGSVVDILDTANHRICRFTEGQPDVYRLQRVLVVSGSDPGLAEWPFQIALGVSDDARYYFSDIGHRFQVFDSDWNFRYQCRLVYPGLSNTIGIAVDPAANVYVGLSGTNAIAKIAPCVLVPPVATPTPTPSPVTPPVLSSIPGCREETLASYAYPNPVRHGILTVYYETCFAGDAELQIYNTASDLVLRQPISGPVGPNRAVMDIGRLATGIYYYQLDLPNAVGGRGKRKVGKFAVIH